MTTCAYYGEFSVASGAVAGQNLTVASSAIPTAWMVVWSGNAGSAGTIVAQGPTPLTFTNTFTGQLSVGAYQNSSCAGSGGTCNILTIFWAPAPCPAPTAHASGLILAASGATEANVVFTAASPAPSGYLAVRYPAGSTPTLPVNGTSYSLNASLGLGTIAYVGTATNFVASGLSGSTTYDVYIYPYATGGSCSISYFTTGAPVGSVTTSACSPLPTDQPTGLNLTVVDARNITGTFTAAASAPNGYLVVRYPAGAATTAPSDNTIYTPGNSIGLGTVIQANSNLSFSASSLNNSTAYDFYVYSYSFALFISA
jgi:hypothetical protein